MEQKNLSKIEGVDEIALWMSPIQNVLLLSENHTVAKSSCGISPSEFLSTISESNPTKFFDVYLEAWEAHDAAERKKIVLHKSDVHTPLYLTRTHWANCLNTPLAFTHPTKDTKLCPSNMQFHAIDIRKLSKDDLVWYNYSFRNLITLAIYPRKPLSVYGTWGEQIHQKAEEVLYALTLLDKQVHTMPMGMKNQAFRLLGHGFVNIDEKLFPQFKKLIRSQLVRIARSTENQDIVIQKARNAVENIRKTTSFADVQTLIMETRPVLESATEILHDYSKLPMDLYILTKLAKRYKTESRRPPWVRNAIIFTGASHTVSLEKYLASLGYIKRLVPFEKLGDKCFGFSWKSLQLSWR